MTTTIVIDNGSHCIKGGFAGIWEPSVTFQSRIGRKKLSSKNVQVFAGRNVDRQLLNNQNYAQYGQLCKDFVVSQPLLDHVNPDWQGIEALWKHLIFDKLQIEQQNDSQTMPVGRNYQNGSNIKEFDNFNLLLTCNPTDSTKYKSSMLELGYETFDAKGIYIGLTPTMSLYSVGKLTGTVIDSGYKNTFVASIFEGYMSQFNIQNAKYGGATVDQCLLNLILQSQRELSSERSHIKNTNKKITLQECEQIKKLYCYIAQDYYEEEGMYNNKNETFGVSSYVLPDGNNITIRNEKYQACELMFQPNIGKLSNQDSLPHLTHESITKCDQSMHKVYFNNIVLAGGNSMIPGFVQRFEKGITHLAPASVKVNINASTTRNYAAFSGASILASQDQMKDIWIYKELYEEIGSQSLIVRCF